MLFAVVNVARHLGVDAELALRGAARKFRTPFRGDRGARRRSGASTSAQADLATLDALWDEVKAVERAGRRVRLQLADPADHPNIGLLPFAETLEDWTLPNVHGVLGLHRHVVRLVELAGRDSQRPNDRTSYVVKELPDHLVQREYRLLRGLAEDRLPTVDVVAAVTERTGGRDGLLITRHLDYSLPYRTLLSGRGSEHPVPRRAPARCVGRAAGAAPPRRVLLG